MALLKMLTTLILVSAVAVGLTGCQKQTQQLRLLSDQEASDIWNKAVAYEPVGGPVVKQLPDDTGACMNVVTNQVYMLTMPGGGRTQIMVGCGGGCKTDGGPLGDCKTSGCLSNGRSCTPLKCSGNCTVSSACKPLTSLVIK
jgi:hypothetical protein